MGLTGNRRGGKTYETARMGGEASTTERGFNSHQLHWPGILRNEETVWRPFRARAVPRRVWSGTARNSVLGHYSQQVVSIVRWGGVYK